MLRDARWNKIVQVIEEKGFISLHELVSEVQASESTVRRDLEYLDGIGQVRRTRGGATYVGESLTDFEDRRLSALYQKEEIASHVADIIQPGEAVLLDGGTTTLEVARKLIGKSLQVVTNSVPIINLLVNQPNIELIAVGGYVYPKTGVALGPMAVGTLERIHVRRLVMSIGGVTEAGLFNSNAMLVETERQMMQSAEEVIVVTDSSKLGHSALAHLCELEEVDRFVMDDGIDENWKSIIRKAGVKLDVINSK